jgi:hypothetical protein
MGVGLNPASWNVTLISASGKNNVSCAPLSSCSTNTTVWPPSPDNAVGTAMAIKGSYPFQSAMGMYWPGSAPVTFGTYSLYAYSEQMIVF